MAIDKITDPSSAAKLYATTAKAASGASAAGADGFSFADLVKSGVQDTIQALKTSEQTSARAVLGKADITDVVQAVTAAESSLQTVVAIRDRLISAYQEILRMPI